MNVCMRYELYALCIERASDKKSRAYDQRDTTFRVGECGGKERKRTSLVLNLDRYYFDNQNEEYLNIMFIVVGLKTIK